MLSFCHFKFCVDQWDQITRLFAQFWPFKVMKICPTTYEIFQKNLKKLPNTKWTLPKWPNVFNAVPKLRNFAKYGHTGVDQHSDHYISDIIGTFTKCFCATSLVVATALKRRYSLARFSPTLFSVEWRPLVHLYSTQKADAIKMTLKSKKLKWIFSAQNLFAIRLLCIWIINEWK